MKPTLRTIASQPAWVMANRQVSLAVTRLGGHMAPVTFCRDTVDPVQPYYISPWQGEAGSKEQPAPVLVPLRGDFFCMPFGGNGALWRGESHPPHGETAGARWRLAEAGIAGHVTQLSLRLPTRVREGQVTKTLSLVEGQNAVYLEHTLEGLAGPMPVGHHAILAAEGTEGSLELATSPYLFGETSPGVFGDPANGQYQSLAAGKRFSDLGKVPLIWKEPAWGDCTAFPARRGFTDLLAVFHAPGTRPAWTAVANRREGWLWYSLKDAGVLPATLLWMANRGRHGAPWNGRNCCLAVEDACAYFAEGLAASARPNELTRSGVATALKLSRKRPTTVRHIQGVVKVPAKKFGRVKTARFAPGEVSFVSTTGKTVTARVNWEFLRTGELA